MTVIPTEHRFEHDDDAAIKLRRDIVLCSGKAIEIFLPHLESAFFEHPVPSPGNVTGEGAIRVESQIDELRVFGEFFEGAPMGRFPPDHRMWNVRFLAKVVDHAHQAFFREQINRQPVESVSPCLRLTLSMGFVKILLSPFSQIGDKVVRRRIGASLSGCFQHVPDPKGMGG